MIMNFLAAHKRAAVFAGMGLGKTASTLAAVRFFQRFMGEGPALILAPVRVAKATWPDEVAKWDDFSDTKVSVLCGDKVRRCRALSEKADIYTMNYENLPWLESELQSRGEPWPFPIVVADESTKIKSLRAHGGGQRGRVLAKHYADIDRFIALTGTPAPNGMQDLWGQVYMIDAGERLGKSYTAFLETYFRPIKMGNAAFAIGYKPLPQSEELIKKRLSDVTVTVNAEDWFDIHEPITRTVEVELDEAQMKTYRQLEGTFLATVGTTEVEAANAAVKTAKCLQLASGAVYKDGSCKDYEVFHDAKLEALDSIIEEAGGAPILVAYAFRHEADRILAKYPKQAKMLDKNPKTLRAWNEGKIPILLAHPASCGHGLSMQDGGNILVFFGTGWSLEEHEQIIERIGPTRQLQSGHNRPVFIYSIVTKGTLDEAVQERIKTKRDVLDILLERKRNEAL